jgi:pimeloyl-ACP methyl ester carboxylesterase
VRWKSIFALPLIWRPTLIIVGTDDPVIPLASAKIIGRLLWHAALQVHDGGHVELISNAAE